MEIVHFKRGEAFIAKAEKRFAAIKSEILAILPGADVEHVGSTAVPGSLTKGDLDVQVRVAPEHFPLAVETLSRRYAVNDGSISTDTFRAFTDELSDPPLGIQLTVRGSEYDFFWKVRDVLLMNEQYRRDYDALKLAYEGKDMDDYRAAKNRFMEWLMQTPEFKSLSL